MEEEEEKAAWRLRSGFPRAICSCSVRRVAEEEEGRVERRCFSAARSAFIFSSSRRRRVCSSSESLSLSLSLSESEEEEGDDDDEEEECWLSSLVVVGFSSSSSSSEEEAEEEDESESRSNSIACAIASLLLFASSSSSPSTLVPGGGKASNPALIRFLFFASHSACSSSRFKSRRLASSLLPGIATVELDGSVEEEEAVVVVG